MKLKFVNILLAKPQEVGVEKNLCKTVISPTELLGGDQKNIGTQCFYKMTWEKKMTIT